MAKILIVGAGRSSTSLIEYLLKQADLHSWELTVGDMDEDLAKQKCGSHRRAKAIKFDSKDEPKRKALIREQNMVISMLPAFMHAEVAQDCVEFGIHMATASYVSKEIAALHETAQKKNIVLLNECGLDPGIDHASAMKIIHDLREQKAEILSFKSYCGGLVAPESNDNPWGYKFSWNPRNVILAGQGTAQYLDNGELRCLPYRRLFAESETVKAGEYGSFDAYANRDSLSYIETYGLNGIRTMLRGTLRQKGFCKAWNVFVQLGLTDDTSVIKHADRFSYAQLMGFFLPPGSGSVQARLRTFMGKTWDEEIEKMMEFLGVFTEKKIGIAEGSPAQILQHLLEEKWKLNPGDKDMIVLTHEFKYSLPGEKTTKTLHSSLMVKGRDQVHTAMALTVGLPLAITVKNILLGRIASRGVQIPTSKEIYEPLLAELEELGVNFKEEILG